VEQVSDGFLLTVAQIAATLVGLLLLGGFFYLETGLSRLGTVSDAGEGFLRATMKLTLLLYALVLVVSLGLVVLRPGWLAVSFVLVGLPLLKAQVTWTLRYRDLRRVLAVPWESYWLSWAATSVALALPWALDGLTPGREAMTWSMLLAGAFALSSTAGLLLTSFDLSKIERAASRSEDATERSDP
jgi:hypothetical protein